LFGYVSPVLSAFSEEQKERYHAAYCGLCHALKARAGEARRLALSNDMTFLSLLLSSLYEPKTEQKRSRCAVHPLKAHDYLVSEMTDYAADMNLLLFYYKCLDQKMDDRTLAGKAGEKTFRKSLSRLERDWPRQSLAVAEALGQLWAEEKKENPNPDLLCNLSGRMLGAVFVPRPDDLWAGELYAVGEGLGRFIYWMDAVEDLSGDLKRNRFNPLRFYRERPDFDEFCRDTLEMLIGEAAEHFELLPLDQDLDLLRNVLYSGVWQRYILMEKKRERKGDAHAE